MSLNLSGLKEPSAKRKEKKRNDEDDINSTLLYDVNAYKLRN